MLCDIFILLFLESRKKVSLLLKVNNNFLYVFLETIVTYSN